MKLVIAKVVTRFKGIEEDKTFEIGDTLTGSIERFKILNNANYVELIKIIKINKN